ncbi:MAG: sedolisin [Burkholderiales bacterium]|jgi:kumamolisin|nr:sedolisin [Burkholderiales bacterium]
MIKRILILLTFVLFNIVASSAGPDLTELDKSIPNELAKATLLSHTDPNQKLNILVWLKGRDPARLQQLLTNLYTPGNPQYHQFITPEQFVASYAPDQANIAAVTDYLIGQGLKIVNVPSNGAFVQIEATVTQAEEAFNVHINQYNLNGKQYYSNDSAVTLNTNVAGMITAISGLDNFWQVQLTHARKKSSVVKSGEMQDSGYTPQQLQSAYGVDQLLRNGIDGNGQVIAIYTVNDDKLIESDFNSYNIQFHLPLCTSINGCFAKFNQNGDSFPLPEIPFHEDASEVRMDIQTAHSLAPGAKIYLYEADDYSVTNMGITFNTIITKNLAQVVSASYGVGGSTEFPESPLESIFKQGAAQGISINFASGDGADYRKTPGPYPSVLYPGSSPWVTSVGGTNLIMTSYNGYKIETGWADPVNIETGSSGGLSKYYTAQTWQSNAIGLMTAGGYTGFIGTRRAVPDISMVGGSNVIIYNTYYPQTGPWENDTGTSIACPLFSAVVALANQKSAEKGKRIGLVTEQLYSMAYNVHQKMAPITNIVAPASTTTSVLTGGPHWNDITGLGSPYAPLFVKALVDSN